MSHLYHKTFVIFFFFLVAITTACSPTKNSRPSYLLIAVEKLPFTGSFCAQITTQEQAEEAFDLLCNESVRFTHMYSPSTQSQAALASILTGLYPNEHKVWHNGNVYLKESIKTVAEVFYEQGWRTSLFSGGGGLWRKSGLSQGFTYFDDSFPVHWNSYYRPAKTSFRNFLRWLDDDQEKAFFSVIYLPDLLFPSISTQDEEGVRRESTYEGQYKYILDSLGFLSKQLKQRGLWHSTNIIVMGLNGKGSEFRTTELDAYNLYSENTQVAFYYKPHSKKRDRGHSWKVDFNYSLTDLGYSLFVERGVSPNESMFVAKNILSKKYEPTDSDRWMMIESGWPQWKSLSTSRFSLRKQNITYFFDEKIKVYNTLIDRLEVNPQIKNWSSVENTEVRSWMQSLDLKPWTAPDSMKIMKWKLAKRLWDPFDLIQNPKEFFNIYESTNDVQVLEWVATLAIKQEKWDWLLKAGEAAEQAIWVFTAKYNLGSLTDEDWSKVNDPCFLQFLKEDNPNKVRLSPTACSDEHLDLLHKWMTSRAEQKETYRELFIRNYLERNISDNIYKLNYIADLSWDMSLRYPAGPSLSDLILSLNKYRTYYTFIKRRMELVQHEKVVY